MKMLPESRFPFRYLFINCFPFQFSQGEFRPAVIRHVLSAVGIDSHHIHFQKTVIITVHFGRIDRYSVAAFDSSYQRAPSVCCSAEPGHRACPPIKQQIFQR